MPQPECPGDVVQLDRIEAPPLPIFKASSGHLDELAGEFAPFTTGVLHTHGGLVDDPIREYVAAHDREGVRVAVRDFDRPFFWNIARDHTEEVWDRRLFLVERRFWPGLRAYLQGVALRDSRAGRYAEARASVVALSSGPGRPGVFVTAFGFSGSWAHLRVAPDGNGRARVVKLPLERDVLAVAHAMKSAGAEALAIPRS